MSCSSGWLVPVVEPEFSHAPIQRLGGLPKDSAQPVSAREPRRSRGDQQRTVTFQDVEFSSYSSDVRLWGLFASRPLVYSQLLADALPRFLRTVFANERLCTCQTRVLVSCSSKEPLWSFFPVFLAGAPYLLVGSVQCVCASCVVRRQDDHRCCVIFATFKASPER